MSGLDGPGDPTGRDGGDAPLPPLEIDMVVAGPPSHAFELWTARTALWWPTSHTISGDPARIVFEPAAGGRIYEQGPDGAEHPWGQIVAFEPPRRISYWWHLFFERSEATLVEVTFEPAPDGTRVRLVQTGWDALGDQGRPRRDRTAMAWSHIADLLRQAATIPPDNRQETPS